MANKVWIFICLLMLQMPGFGQKQIIRGIVTDLGEEMRIAHVNIQIEGTLTGCASDLEGGFEIAVERFPVIVHFSHVAYNERQVRIYSPPVSPLIIRLEEKVTHLRGFTFYSGPIINLIEDKPLYVWDYEFHPDGIILLGSVNKKPWDQRVMLISPQGDTVTTTRLTRPRSLYKDCLGYYHLLTDKTAYQLETDSLGIRLNYSLPVGEFNEVMMPLVAGSKEKFIVRRDYYSNQVLIYYIYNSKTKESHVIREIRSEDGLIRLKDRARLASMPGYTEADERFEEMCFYASMYAPLLIIGDSIVLFNFVDGQIEILDWEGKMLSTINIEFHKRKGWDERILFDQSTQQIYTQSHKAGITSLWEIDLASGKISREISIPDLPFVEKVKVDNDQVYFLYQNGAQPLKQLYRMGL